MNLEPTNLSGLFFIVVRNFDCDSFSLFEAEILRGKSTNRNKTKVRCLRNCQTEFDRNHCTHSVLNI